VAPVPGSGGEKPYALLLAAMERTSKVAVATFVLRTKEYLAAVRPRRDALALETLFYADEVRPASEIWGMPVTADVSERELEIADTLIDFLAITWEPERYRDADREHVMELVRQKIEGRELVREEPVPEAPKVVDLMEALRRSVETIRMERDRAPNTARARRRTS
jgi:DNA end-binding protein Ku